MTLAPTIILFYDTKSAYCKYLSCTSSLFIYSLISSGHIINKTIRGKIMRLTQIKLQSWIAEQKTKTKWKDRKKHTVEKNHVANMQGATMWSGKKMKSSMKRCTDDDKFMIVKENVLGPTILQFFFVCSRTVGVWFTINRNSAHLFCCYIFLLLLVSFSHENVCDAYFSFFSRSFLT